MDEEDALSVWTIVLALFFMLFAAVHQGGPGCGWFVPTSWWQPLAVGSASASTGWLAIARIGSQRRETTGVSRYRLNLER